MARHVSRWVLLVLTLVLVGCDHATKLVATGLDRTLGVVPGVLDLTYTQNHDTAFSLLHGLAVPGKTWVILAAQVFGSIAVAWVWWRRRSLASTLEHVGWSLVLAGALGNAIDRVARGYVVDFIHLHHWPVFNVADVAIVLGLAAVLVATRGRLRSAATPMDSP
jgi:signal peptidase II